MLVTETDAEAKAYLAKPDCAVRYYFYYLSSLMKKAGFSQIMKGLEQFDDEQLTVDWAIDNIVVAGSPATVAEKLLAVREQVGPFGTMVLTGLDWDDKALWQRSMALMANEVMPRAAPGDRRGDRRQVMRRGAGGGGKVAAIGPSQGHRPSRCRRGRRRPRSARCCARGRGSIAMRRRWSRATAG